MDSCKGDSGGPLILAGSDATTDVQVGIVSFGLGNCANVDFPGVYSEISSLLDWINTNADELTSSGGNPTPAPTPQSGATPMKSSWILLCCSWLILSHRLLE